MTTEYNALLLNALQLKKTKSSILIGCLCSLVCSFFAAITFSSLKYGWNEFNTISKVLQIVLIGVFVLLPCGVKDKYRESECNASLYEKQGLIHLDLVDCNGEKTHYYFRPDRLISFDVMPFVTKTLSDGTKVNRCYVMLDAIFSVVRPEKRDKICCEKLRFVLDKNDACEWYSVLSEFVEGKCINYKHISGKLALGGCHVDDKM